MKLDRWPFVGVQPVPLVAFVPCETSVLSVSLIGSHKSVSTGWWVGHRQGDVKLDVFGVLPPELACLGGEKQGRVDSVGSSLGLIVIRSKGKFLMSSAVF